MKRLLLFICAMFVGVANAEPTNTSNSFPLDELMQPDYRYLNSAIYPNTGVYDGDVTVAAQYDWDLFSPTAGQYLPANSTTITQCTAGNFCAGATNIHYDSIDQGITACSTLGDNSYTQSAVGSANETDCYRNCSGNVTIEHATTVTGNDYYGGTNDDTCTAFACENGYSVNSGLCNANTLTITWQGVDTQTVANANAGTCTYGGAIRTPPAPAHIPGKTFVGWRVQLPYTPIEYIESTGTQYIDTGFKFTGNVVKYELKYNMSSSQEYTSLFGASDKNKNWSGIEHYRNSWSGTTIDSALYIGSSVEVSVVTTTLGTTYQYSLSINRNDHTWTRFFNYVQTSGNFAGTVTNNINIVLFAQNFDTYIKQKSSYKNYGFKITQDGVLIRDMIPVKDANGVACMYDRVGKRFYYNSGTGNFIAGPNL